MTDRELDALVAEKVTGWHSDCMCYGKPAPHPPPAYSTSIAAAWEVVEKILELTHPCPYPAPKYTGRGFRLEKRTEDQDDCDVWLCRLPETTAAPPHEEMTYGVSAEDKSAPRAICLAALRAIGVEV